MYIELHIAASSRFFLLRIMILPSFLKNFGRVSANYPRKQLAMQSGAKKVAEQFVTFLNRAITPFHAVEECCRLLKSAGFNELKETDSWQLKPLNKYFVTRNKSTIIASAIGGKYVPGNGLSMIAAHTDSPNLRVKPVSKLTSGGCLQVGVTTYGSGLWRTWFDRKLTVAGRVIVKDDAGKMTQRLMHIERPLMCIPNLAIHLDRESKVKFVFNKEDHLKPILATCVSEKLNEKQSADQKSSSGGQPVGLSADHHSVFLVAIAEHLGVNINDIVDLELCVVDLEPACIGGRLDNLVGAYTAITGLIDSLADPESLKNDINIRVAACYDNEECGSQSAQGAKSSLTEWIFRRLNSPSAYGSNSDGHAKFEESIAKSYLISADQAHALHPNYKSKYAENHGPAFHKGVVVSFNPDQRYATTAVTHAVLKQIAIKADVPLQKYVSRNDLPDGSTVGPIMSAKLGLQTIDVGTPQLAMHSISEMCDIGGIFYAQKLFTKFYEILPEILRNTNV